MFCFSKYSASIELCRDLPSATRLLEEIYSYFSRSFENIKLTFTGGEPFLIPELGELLKISKEIGYVTSVITNASLVTRKWLEKYGDYIDWFGVSLDSAKEEVEKMLGRGYGQHVRKVYEVVRILREIVSRVKIKINTVVTKLNYTEDMSHIIIKLSPHRWKVFQVVIMKDAPEEAKFLAITEEEFMEFVRRHKFLNPVAETCDDSRESYLMIDPMGRFYYRDKNATHRFSDLILSVGVKKALSQVKFNYEKFLRRGGAYIL